MRERGNRIRPRAEGLKGGVGVPPSVLGLGVQAHPWEPTSRSPPASEGLESQDPHCQGPLPEGEGCKPAGGNQVALGPRSSCSGWDLLGDGVKGRWHSWRARATSFSHLGGLWEPASLREHVQDLGALTKGRGGGCGRHAAAGARCRNPAFLPAAHSRSAWGKGRVGPAEVQPASSLR